MTTGDSCDAGWVDDIHPFLANYMDAACNPVGATGEGFEVGYGGSMPQPGPDTEPFNNWSRIEGAGFPEGPAIRTSKSIYLGFGFEGVTTKAARNELMDRAMQYLQ